MGSPERGFWIKASRLLKRNLLIQKVADRIDEEQEAGHVFGGPLLRHEVSGKQIRKTQMPNRKLTKEEINTLFQPLVTNVRHKLHKLSKGDSTLFWALRRKLAKELTYDERGKPMQRQKLKQVKRVEQKGKCASCGRRLPQIYIVLDRFEAMKGYTQENTRLICQKCDQRIQKERGYS